MWLVLSKHDLIIYTQKPYGIDTIITPGVLISAIHQMFPATHLLGNWYDSTPYIAHTLWN